MSRGRAVPVACGVIRMLEVAEALQERRVQAQMRADVAYWREIAAQRGGTEEQLYFNMQVRAEAPAMLGGPEGHSTVRFEPRMLNG